MGELRRPFFIAAVVWLALAFLIEVAASQWLLTLTGDRFAGVTTPGLAIRYLAIFDGLLLYNMALEVVDLSALLRRFASLVKGPVTVVLAIVVLFGALGWASKAFAMLTVMIALLLATPFGTIAYMTIWGHFAVKTAAVALTLAMVLKLLFCLFLVLAHQRFLQNKSLVLLVLISLGLTYVTGFVHALLPRFLVSIGDTAVALVTAIVAAIWLLLLAVSSLVPTVRAVWALLRARVSA